MTYVTYLEDLEEGDAGLPLLGRFGSCFGNEQTFGVGIGGQRGIVIGRGIIRLNDDAIRLNHEVLQEFDKH